MRAFAVLMVIAVTMIAATAHAQEDYTKVQGLDPLVRNFAGMGHGGSKCIYCHAFLMPDEEYEKKFLKAGCRCHQPDVANGYNVRINDVRELHDSNHCRLCHAGTKNVTFSIYHQKVHNRIPCTRCHTIRNVTDFTISKPKTMRCKACHKYDIHYIHADVLGKVCKMCHGTQFASRYTRKDLEKLNLKEEIINKTLSEGETKKEVKKVGFITISKILAFIIDLIF